MFQDLYLGVAGDASVRDSGVLSKEGSSPDDEWAALSGCHNTFKNAAFKSATMQDHLKQQKTRTTSAWPFTLKPAPGHAPGK